MAKFSRIFKLRLVAKQMDWVERLEWVNDYSKKHCRRLFWRVRASLKKAIKNGDKQQLTFEYDPSSYALNFDDDSFNLREEINALQKIQSQDSPASRNSTWVFVL